MVVFFWGGGGGGRRERFEGDGFGDGDWEVR